MDVKERIDNDHHIDYFLNQFITKKCRLDQGQEFTNQYLLFVRGDGPYRLDRFIDSNRNNGKRYKPNSPWEFNRNYWMQMKIRFGTNEKVML